MMGARTAAAILGVHGHGNGKSSLGGMIITFQSGWNSRAQDFSVQSAQAARLLYEAAFQVSPGCPISREISGRLILLL